MVYNSAQCKMKRSIFLVIGVMIAFVFASGCAKEATLSTVYEVTITFDDAAGNQLATQAYTELKNQFSPSDAILVYMTVANVSGDDLWMPLPLIDGSQYYEYAYSDNGIFAFTANAGEDYVWTNVFSKTYRIIKIPRSSLVTKSAVDFNDYNEVMRAYNLYDAPVVRK